MKSALAWFAANSVAANLLMWMLVAGGLLALPALPKKVFPDVAADVIEVQVEYRGASPADVEQGLCTRVEDAIEGLAAIDRVSSTALEGLCVTFVELVAGSDVDRTLADVKTRIDAVDTFPTESEEPVIRIVEQRYPVVDVAIFGDVPYEELRALGRDVRDELLRLPGITSVSMFNDRLPIIDVELDEPALQSHGLTFDEVAKAIRKGSVELPGGLLETPDAEILVRGSRQAESVHEFERIMLRSRADGTRILVGDVAAVTERPDPRAPESTYDGRPAVSLRVYRVGSQDAVGIKHAVDAYVAERTPTLPPGVEAEAWLDTTDNLRNRVDILVRNGRSGFLLVLIVLSLFLRPRLAFWVGAGVPISLLGAIGCFAFFGLSIDPISVFAFIVVLGLLVDDAIVVGESIHAERDKHETELDAAVAGARRVQAPVVFGVLTSVAAFAPMLVIPGTLGGIIGVIAVVAILCLLASIAESLFVLPAHLAHGRRVSRGVELTFVAVPMLVLAPRQVTAAALLGLGVLTLWRGTGFVLDAVDAVRKRAQSGLARFRDGAFARAVEITMARPATTLAGGVALVLVVFSLAASGRVPFHFFPPIEADWVMLAVTLEPGASRERMRAVLSDAEAAADRVRLEVDAEAGSERSLFRGRLATVGGQPMTGMLNSNTGGIFAPTQGSHVGEVSMGLLPPEQRAVTSGEIAERWRREIGEVPDALSLDFGTEVFSTGAPLAIRLEGADLSSLHAAAEELVAALSAYPGVFGAEHSFRPGKQEVKLSIRPEAEAQGLGFLDLARQVRQAVHGEEVQRFQRGVDDVEVRVRLPRDDRRSLAVFDAMRVRTPSGDELPFHAAAHAEISRGYSEIRREYGRRIVDVTARVDRTVGDPTRIFADFVEGPLPAVLARHPGVAYRLEGEQREQGAFLANLMRAFAMALIVIYGLLAIPLRSYLQPLLVMAAIPFGLAGAVLGHIVMRHPLSMMSIFGFVALTGVVVNSSLVLLDAANRERAEGADVRTAFALAARARLRPILLTTLTTFLGLTPLMLERSTDALFLVPTAISLAWGVLLATPVTLFGLPAAACAFDALRNRLRDAIRRLFRGSIHETADELTSKGA